MLPGLVATDSDLVAELLARPSRPTARASRAEDDLEHALADGAADARGRVLPRAPRLRPAHRRARPPRLPPALPRAARASRRLEQGWVLASETPALDVIGATFVRELEPGEMVVIDADEVARRSVPWPGGALDPRLCIFEFVYFARPDSRLYGSEVHGARRRMGELLADQAPVDGRHGHGRARLGRARRPRASPGAAASPTARAWSRTATSAAPSSRPTRPSGPTGVRRKLNPLRDNIAGKRLVVVDDSIVRGTTTRAMVRMLREAGAAEVHLRISSPPYRWPCFYGIDTPDRTSCSPPTSTVDEIREFLGADSPGLPQPRAPEGGHRRAGRRVLRRLPHRRLPGAGPGQSASGAVLTGGAGRSA